MAGVARSRTDSCWLNGFPCVSARLCHWRDAALEQTRSTAAAIVVMPVPAFQQSGRVRKFVSVSGDPSGEVLGRLWRQSGVIPSLQYPLTAVPGAWRTSAALT